MIIFPPRSARLAHHTTAYWREATIVSDSVVYACELSIDPTSRYERVNRNTDGCLGLSPYAKQLGLIHSVIGPRVFTDFYNTLSSVLRPGSPVITEPYHLWQVWRRPRHALTNHPLRAACLIYPTVERAFEDIIEEFLLAERRTRPYKFSHVEYA